jgi:hypothetical protein
MKAYVAVAGDADLDGTVNDVDFTVLLNNWGSGSTWSECDFNADGTVDDTDFTMLLNNWGYSAD